MKIFLDANILVAASGNMRGGSAYLFQIAEQDHSWHLLTSGYAVAEARLNVEKKLTHTLSALSQFLISPRLTIVHPPPSPLLLICGAVVSTKDAPILAAAIVAKADVLCTLDKKDFHTKHVKQWSKKYHLKIVEPRTLFARWRKQNERNV